MTGNVLHDFGEAVVAFFTIVLALSTIALWRATEKLFGAGERQMKLLEKNAIADQRAWLAVSDLQLHDDVRFGRHGIDFHISVKITNFGKTPALAAHTNMEVITDFAGSTEAIRKLAEKSKTERTYWSRMVFPGEFYRRRWGLTVELPTPPSNSVSPVVVGCVTYEILPDRSVHQTGFAFGLFECKAGTDDFVDLIRVDKGQISRDRIGSHADPGGFAD
jgi:hypothetical protein